MGLKAFEKTGRRTGGGNKWGFCYRVCGYMILIQFALTAKISEHLREGIQQAGMAIAGRYQKLMWI
jgi:hypothetical protein